MYGKKPLQYCKVISLQLIKIKEKKSIWLHWTPPSTKSHINILTIPHYFFEPSLRALWGAVSWASVLILPQIKLNSQLLSCASFLVNDANHCFSCLNYFNQTLLFYSCILTALSHQSHNFVSLNIFKHIEQIFFLSSLCGMYVTLIVTLL